MRIADVELKPNYPIETARLRLRPLTVADISRMLTYRSQEEVCRYLPFEPMTAQELAERFDGELSRTEITAERQALTLGVELAGELIGDVVLFFLSEENACGEIGYVFHPDVGGQGYATEACSAVLALAFEQLGVHRMIARLDARNDQSARLAARLGMRLEAHLVENEMFKGEWSDELIYAILAAEWPTSPAHRVHRPAN